MNKIRVAIGGIHYPLSMMSYFIRAFQRREDVDLWLYGPSTSTWIPWNNGMYINPKYVVMPDFALPASSIGINPPSAIVNTQMPWTPDLTIQIDAGWHTKDRPRGNIVAHVQTDPHVLKNTYVIPKQYSDLNFCMQKVYSTYDEIYLPYAYDPTVHYPMPEVVKEYDACLIGLQYDKRMGLIRGLQSHNLRINSGIGLVFDEYRLAYNQSKVALSWSSLLDIPARVFEGMAMGLPLVANRLPDMPLFFEEGVDYLGFDNEQEAIKQVLSLLIDDEYSKKIATNGYNKVKNHTWDARVRTILEHTKLI